MSQQKPVKLSSASPRPDMAPANRNGNQRGGGVAEAMEVEVPSFDTNVPMSDLEENANMNSLSQDERLRAWFNVNRIAQNADNPDVACPIEEHVEAYEDTEDEARATGLVEARFENISRFRQPHCKSDTRVFGEVTTIRCLPWRILAIFHPPESGSMGFFVQCNADSDSQTWSCSAKATLVLVAHRSNCKNKEMKITHTFTHKENDWGFQSFIPYDELFNSDRGYLSIVDGVESIVLQAHVKADAPHGADWDSKRHTGFVGLKNQGATCYLNSLLQALYCTNKLRRAVFLMPTESDDAQTSVPLALQRVFYELQFSDRAVGTKKLTRSFGWATLDSFMQHDAQELCRVLLDNLESKMKGTSVEDVIPGLFCGKMLSYIRCINVQYESKREENFYDIQLKVNGNRTVYDAFTEYIAKETLSQDNQYDAGEYGLQEAEKGVIFTRFPPVLYLQLMRFQYDFVADTNVKINDRFEFMYHLNLDRFLLKPDPLSPAAYFLHAVLVHSGDNHGGHYVVYVNPAGNGIWYQFDDDVVSRCSARDAIYMNFGGNEDPDMRPCTNAYMLVYIAESARADVLCPLSICDIPESLRERFIEEQQLEEAKRLDKERVHLYMVIHLLLDEDFYGWQGPELCCQEFLPSRMLRVPKQTTKAQLIEAVATSLNYFANNIRLWHFRPRRKNTPTHLVELGDNFMQYSPKDIHIYYVQLHNDGSSIPQLQQSVLSGADQEYPHHIPLSDRRLFFLKYFDPISWSMSFCGHVEVSGDATLSSVEATMLERVDLPPTCSLIVYQDDPRSGITELPHVKLPISRMFKREHQGHLLYFQVKPNASPTTALLPSCSPLHSASVTSDIVIPEESAEHMDEITTGNITHTLSSVPDESKFPQPHQADDVISSGINGLVSTALTGARAVNAPDDQSNDNKASTACSVVGYRAGVDALSALPNYQFTARSSDILYRMAVVPSCRRRPPASPDVCSPNNQQVLSPQLPTVTLSDNLHIFDYVNSFLQQLEILLVDKLRPNDPGVLLRVATDLSYWDFANVVAGYLSTKSNQLQFFRSQQIFSGTGVPTSVPVSPLGSAGATGLLNMEISSSPVGSDNSPNNADGPASGLGVGAGSHNTGITTATPPTLSPQAVAARASGFVGRSTYTDNLLSIAASQGLSYEPPGAAIPSTHSETMREFFLPFTVSPTNSSWASDVAGLGSGIGSGPGSLVAAAAAAANLPTPDRFPVPLNRFCGAKTVTRSPFGPVTFPPPRRVYYAHLAIRIDELETMRQVRVTFVGPKLNNKVELLLSIPQNGLVEDLLKEARRHLVLQTDGSGQLRLLEVFSNRIFQEYPTNRKLSSIPLVQGCLIPSAGRILRIEEVPLDEINMSRDETVVYVSHLDKELQESFGIPFTIRIRDGEHYSAVRERIRRRLEVPEKEFERWRFAVMFPTEATYIPHEEDPVVMIKNFNQPCHPEYRPWLAIEHKPSKRPRYAPNEKPIKIHN